MTAATLTEKAREDRARRALVLSGHRLNKTPSRHWTRAEYGPGYMITDDRNIIRLGAGQREYEATLVDVEHFIRSVAIKAA